MREEDLEAKLLDIATHISRLYSELELIREEVFQLIRNLKKKG
ncbi:MAG: hypothetical protein QXJ68_08985 [Methanocellales archaeon]